MTEREGLDGVGEMEIGLSIPQLLDGDSLKRFVQRAEALGFESVLAGDHIVLPTAGTDQYPYTADGSFARPAEDPFLETMPCWDMWQLVPT